MYNGWLVGQLIINGLVLGGVYVLIATGFTLCMGVLRLINVTQGHFYMLGSFFTFQAIAWWMGPTIGPAQYAVAILFSAVVVGAIGLAVHFIAIWPVFHRGQIAPMITTIAMAFMIENMAIVAWAGPDHPIPKSLTTVRRFGQINLSDQRVATFAAALSLIVLLYLFLQKTRTGKAMRATTQNELSASLMGINPEYMRALAIMLSAALAAAAGGLNGPLFSIEPQMGVPTLFTAIVVVLIGGMGNIPGAVVGGLFLGLLESLVGGLWSAAWVNVIEMVTVILVLMIRPEGIMGSKVRLTRSH